MNPYMSKPKIDKNIQIPTEILKNLLTPSELRMLKNRWHIINLLKEGLTIRAVAEEVKVGTDTVVRVARMLEKSNLQNLLNQEKKSIKQLKRSPWVFGKSE